MCMKTKDGYKLSTGRLIKYDDFDLSLLTPKEFVEITEQKASLLEMFSIKKDVSKILTGVDELKTIQAKTNASILEHHTVCPINKQAIEQIVNHKLNIFRRDVKTTKTEDGSELKHLVEIYSWENLKEKLLTGGKIAKAIIAIATLLLAVGIIAIFVNNIDKLLKMILKI